jgi:hypothetical protein
MNFEGNEFKKFAISSVAFSLLFIVACVSIMVFLPTNSSEGKFLFSKSSKKDAQNIISFFEDENNNYDLVMDLSKKEDCGLVLYRQPQSKAAVEWFYSRVTNNREIAQAILVNADKNDIPLALAFALAYTESRYKATAMNRNTNGSIDRGLFQLNNNSFPKLSEADFYDVNVSAKYGLSHLRFCLNSAGNEIAALAMYNAGTNKVKKNNTPHVTLNYISHIQSYRSALEENFATEVLAVFDLEGQSKLLASR